MRHLLTLISLLLTFATFSQEVNRPSTKRVIVKTNLLSLVAQRPTVTVEKLFPKSFSAEISFVQGQFNNFLFTDHYNYTGFLLRAKKYLSDIDFGSVNPYAAVYAGNLKRNIQTGAAQIGSGGYIGYASRDFSANSIRGGGTLGLSYISNSKFVFDGLLSLGYGRYTKLYKADNGANANGYLDAQVWLSIGYCF